MPRLLPAAALALLTALPLPLAAQSLSFLDQPLTESDRAVLHEEFRAFLMENPEVIFDAVGEYERRSALRQAQSDVALVEINAEDIFADGYSWVGGNPDGDIVMVEFMDYRCGYCRRAYPQVNELLAADGNIAFVVKELPILGPQSEVMSRFAVAVQQLGGDEAYERVHEQLIVLEGEPVDAVLEEMARGVGLEPEAVLARMSAREVTDVLSRNRALAQRLQISGTPSFVMGDGRSGEMLRGFAPVPQMQEIVDRLRG